MIRIENYIYFNMRTINTKKSMFGKLRIKPRSYIGTVISRLYDYYLANAVSLEKEYRKYYKKEFRDFESFLRNKHNLFDWEIKRLGKHNIYISQLQLLEEYGIGYFASDIYEDNTIIDAFNKSILKKRVNNED